MQPTFNPKSETVAPKPHTLGTWKGAVIVVKGSSK